MARFVIALVALFVGCEVAEGVDDVRDDIAAEADGVDIADALDEPGDSTIVDSDVAEVEPGDVVVPPRDFGPPIPEALEAALQRVLDEHFADVSAAAVSLGVRLPDGSWWEGVAGHACSEPATDVVVGDRFRLGSITKTWVAAVVLQLVDEGRVDLDASLEDYVAGFDLDPAVTVRACLAHTTGIFDLTDDPLSVEADFSQPIAPEEVVRQSLARAPVFAPGAGYSYSNTNYFLLGLLIERVTGEPIARVFRERMLDPLGLIDTYLEDAEPPPDAGTPHICGNAGPVDVTDLLDMSWSWAAGAMVSSSGDLCRWADALWRGDVLPPALRDAMMTPTVLPDGSAARYGLGTQITRRGGMVVVGHNGQTLGFQSELYIDPASGLCIAVLANDLVAATEAVGVPAWDLLVPALGLR